jgi:hypothetical protein
MLTTDMHNTCILNISAGRKNELETKATSSVLTRAEHRAGQPLAFDSRTTDAGLHNKGMHRPRTAELLPKRFASEIARNFDSRVSHQHYAFRATSASSEPWRVTPISLHVSPTETLLGYD